MQFSLRSHRSNQTGGLSVNSQRRIPWTDLITFMLDQLTLRLQLMSGHSPAAHKAVRFAALCAVNIGAQLFDPNARVKKHGLHIAMTVNADTITPQESQVNLRMEDWHDEATLFAQSGLANLLGDPGREPLIPAANYAAHTLGYAIFAAITALYAKWVNHGKHDKATIHAVPTLAWVNWKAVAAGQLNLPMLRQGDQSEWPVIPCKDGFVAFLFTERDW